MANQVDIDFSVFSNPYFLKVMDLSVWALIENEPSIIEITLPGYESKKTLYFDKCKTNVYNSVLLGINCTDGCDEPNKVTLPDGIYHIKVIGSPDTFNAEKYYLKTDLYDMDVDKVVVDTFNKKNPHDLYDKLKRMELLVIGAESHLRSDDITRASMLFEQAQSMVDDLKNCTDCN